MRRTPSATLGLKRSMPKSKGDRFPRVQSDRTFPFLGCKLDRASYRANNVKVLAEMSFLLAPIVYTA